jgi:glutathione S-transferase
MADICAHTTVDFASLIGLPLDPALTHLAAWHGRVSARPSAAA